MTEINISQLRYSEGIQQLHQIVGDLSNIHCHIHFSADFSQSKIIRDFIGLIFDENHILPPWKGRFILITDELINNAIEHGSQKSDINSCIIHVQHTREGNFQIKLEVHDTGRGKDSKKSIDLKEIMGVHTRNKGIYMGKRGRGLFHITEKLVDTLTFRESMIGGLAVCIEKTLTKDSIAGEN